MKLPLWCKINNRWIILTHFPDGKIGLTMQQAITQKLNGGYGTGMGKLNIEVWRFDGADRFLVEETK